MVKGRKNKKSSVGGTKKRGDASLVPALERGLDVLDTLIGRQDGLTYKEMLSILDIPRPSIFRLLHELHERDYVRQDPHTKRYFLGFKALLMSSVVLKGLDVHMKARPIMQGLVYQTGESVELAVPDDEGLLILDKIEGQGQMHVSAIIGRIYSFLHTISHGKIFIAWMGEEEMDACLKKGLAKRTEKTITDIKIFKGQLEQIRKDGYAFDIEEAMHFISRCSAPIFNHEGKVVAAIGVAIPSFRFDPAQKDTMGQRVKLAALQISKQMGFKRG